MPLKLNVGLSRKIGKPNTFSSRGANTNIELELDMTLVQKPEELQARIRQLFALARSAVDEELADNGQQAERPAPGNGNGQPAAPRPVTASQIRAVRAISRAQGLNLEELLRQQFGVARPEELSLPQASQLIDQLKARGARAAVPGGP
jgi:hypothetical protein